jgi:hypothetical protein
LHDLLRLGGNISMEGVNNETQQKAQSKVDHRSTASNSSRSLWQGGTGISGKKGIPQVESVISLFDGKGKSSTSQALS